MPAPSRLSLAKEQIVSFFSNAQQVVYAKSHLAGVLLQHRKSWHLNESTTAEAFISFLKQHGNLQTCTIRAEAYGQEITRYCWGKASKYEIALSIKPRAYLCHATALSLHRLAKPNASLLYLNSEQSPKPPPSGPLTQERIDSAFSREQRYSNLIYVHRSASFIVISGKNTGRLGVEEMRGPDSEKIAVTSLERTLIDVVVRPAYAGGISQVLAAYRAAREKVAIDRLLLILRKLDYIYPYHQAIGFLMHKAGYGEQLCAELRALGLRYDFYLAHDMQEPAYSKEWRTYYPSDLEQ